MDHDELEEHLLGAACDLTREDVNAAAGVPDEAGRALWNAMGLPEVPMGEKAFTERDVDSLCNAVALRDSGFVDNDTMLVLARSMGQSLSRMAEAQVEVFRQMSAGMSVEQATGVAMQSSADVLPKLENIVVHIWRRQFAAATARAFAAVTEDGHPVRAVGFVDLVDFTHSTQIWDASTLERTLERFESQTSARVTNVGGQVIKTLGDAVLFTTDDATSAVEVALQTVEAHIRDDDLPDVRAGVAVGPLLVRLGDVFGQPVNIASRLTSEARPHSLLVDAKVAEQLQDDGEYVVKPLRKRAVRGYRSLVPYLLRRAGGD